MREADEKHPPIPMREYKGVPIKFDIRMTRKGRALLAKQEKREQTLFFSLAKELEKIRAKIKRNPVVSVKRGIKKRGKQFDRWKFKNGTTMDTPSGDTFMIACDPRNPIKISCD